MDSPDNNNSKTRMPLRREKPVVEVAFANRVLRARVPVEFAKTNDNNNQNDVGSTPPKPQKTVELIGQSWAADHTAFVVPEFDVALDAGCVVQSKRMSSVLITHAHTDHIHYLTHFKSRSKPPNFYLPKQSVANAEQFLDVAQQLTSDITKDEYEAYEWTTCYRFCGVQAGDCVTLNKKRGLYARVVRCDHSISCVGYCIYQERSSLRPEYRHLPGPEIGQLRRQGVEVTTTETVPLLCFLGDTLAAVLNGPEAEHIFACPTVVIECTFLTDDCIENAERTKHVVWCELKPHVLRHPETTFVLTHFSHRWSTRDIYEFFAQQDDIPNVIPWIPSGGEALFCKPVGGDEIGAGPVDEVWSHF